MGHRHEHIEINDDILQEICQGRCGVAVPRRKQQKIARKRCEDHIDSAKSEDEAATFIQAFYRGYKVRRKFYEIKRTSSEEKRNTKKVAELLGVPDVLNTDDGKKSAGTKENHTSPGDTLQENGDEGLNIGASATQNEELLRSHSEKHEIETIKSPAFDNNDISSSVSPSEITDNDDQQFAKIEEKSAGSFQTHEILYQNPMYKNIPGSKCDHESFSQHSRKSKNFITRYQPSRKKISKMETIFQVNESAYFTEASLYYTDKEALLLFGGIDPFANYGSTGNTGKDIYRYVLGNNVWEFVGEIPEPRHHHSVAYLKGRIYLAGGADPSITDIQRKGNTVSTVWSFDPTSRTWYKEPSMCTPRRNFGLVVSHGKLFAFGGQDENGMILKTAETYDPNEGTWKEIQPMSMPRMGLAIAKYGNSIWIAGGIKNFKKESLLKDVECYDPVRNTWSKSSPLSQARAHASMFVTLNDLYIVGGAGKIRNDTHSVTSIDIWDSNTRTWKCETEMAIPRYGHSTGSIGDCLIIIGGVTTNLMETLNSVECYSYKRKKWIKNICSLPYAISSHSAVSLPPMKS